MTHLETKINWLDEYFETPTYTGTDIASLLKVYHTLTFYNAIAKILWDEIWLELFYIEITSYVSTSQCLEVYQFP